MFRHKKIIIALFFIIGSIISYSNYRKHKITSKTAYSVFGKWIRSQKVFEDINFSLWTGLVNDQYIKHFRNTIPKDIYKQLEFTHFPFSTPHGNLRENKEKIFIKKISTLIEELNKNFPEFVKTLINSSFVNSTAYNKYKNLTNSKIREKYKIFLKALFYHKNEQIQKKALFTLANKLFEHAYNPKTSTSFIKLASNKKYRPIIHLFHEGIWYNLSRTGWKTWHENTIKNLNKLNKNEIVYVAGGTDIYQLINNGIYNIRIIDPMLPSQSIYYSEGWEYLIRGSIGDRITFNNKNKIIMTRSSFKKIGKPINIKLSSKKNFNLTKSITIWNIKNKNGHKLGRFILERRLVKQKDFNPNDKQTFLMSFNELNFITTLEKNNWGIKPKLFSPSIKIYVKQLRNPITYEMLNNIQALQRVYKPFIFGSAIN